MNSMIGKSTGIALLMAAALLAALFAMGVFSATSVGAHDPDQADDGGHGTGEIAAHDELTANTGIVIGFLTDVTSPATTDGAAWTGTTPLSDTTTPAFAYNADDHEYDLTVLNTWDALYLLVEGDTTVEEDEVMVKVNGKMLEAEQLGLDTPVALDTAAAGSVAYKVDLTDDAIVTKIEVIADDADNNTGAEASGPGTYVINVKHDNAATSNIAGAAVSVSLELTGLAAEHNDDITIEFPSAMGLPGTIDDDNVFINSGTGNQTPGVSVNGKVVTITVPDMDGDASNTVAEANILAADSVMIRFKQSAGITNPNVAGMYGIKVKDGSTVAGQNVVMVIRSISLDPKKGSSKADVTVTGKGFSTGSATVFIDKKEGAEEDDAATTDVDESEDTYEADMMYKVGVDKIISQGASITDGSFTVTVAGIAKPEDVDMVTISAFDGANNLADKTATYTFAAGLSADPEMISWGQVLTLDITDYTGTPTEVRFGGNNEYKNDVEDGATSKKVKVKVPPGVPVGNQKVEILDSTVAGLSTTVEIVPLSLSISPSGPVPGQQVTISGSGYEGTVQIKSVKFGSLDEIAITDTSKTSTSAGSVSFTYKVPLNVGTGSKMVSLDVGERTGQGTITVPKPSISISPTESLIGSDVTITGTGFASSSRVEVFYSEVIEAVGTSDSNGNVSIRLTVPSAAGIGKTNTVEVRDRTEATIKATASHKTPGAMLTVPERAQSGSTITISGSNFQGFSTLSEVMIGGQDAKPAPAPETDRQGTFSIQVRVPRLAVGSQTISVKDGNGNSATETFSIVDTPVSRAPADVFAERGDRLSRVWYLDRMTQEWSFYDPAPEFAAFNSLTEVISGEVYQIIITEGDPVEFQGKTLYKGTNPISLR